MGGLVLRRLLATVPVLLALRLLARATGGFDERWLLLAHDRWRGFAGGRFGWMLDATRGGLRRPLYWAALAFEQSGEADASSAVHWWSFRLYVALLVLSVLVALWWAESGRDAV